MSECHTCGPICYCEPERPSSAYMGDPYLPPGCSDNDDYFDMPNANGAYKPARQTQAPVCGVCNVEPIYIRNMETKVWHCLECAFKAGEPGAAIWMAHRKMDELLSKPTIDEDKEVA